MIPIPDEIPLGPDEFLTPFPIFLESATLNPCIHREKVVKDILSIEQKTPYDQKLLEEILVLYPDSIPMQFFLEHLPDLVKKNADFVSVFG